MTVKERILVVDDLLDVRKTLAGILSDEGYQVHTASNSAEALQALASGPFELAVVDVRLDESNEDNRDGLTFMRQIQAEHPAVSVVVLTGYADLEMVREALEPSREGNSLAAAFLQKSEIADLGKCIERVLGRRSYVHHLIAQGEGEHIEFKSSIRWDYLNKSVNKNLEGAVARTLAGMLNREGGTLVIGVADDGTVLGLEKDYQTLMGADRDAFERKLTDIVEDSLGVEFMPYVRPHFDCVEGKDICVMYVEKSPCPVYFFKGYSHEFWVRMGNSTRQMDLKAAVGYIQAHWPTA